MTTSAVRTSPPSLLDPSTVANRCAAFVGETVESAGANGAVINLSGGIDSSVTAHLAVDALGAGAVTGMILPTDVNRSENINDARRLAENLGIAYRELEIQPILDQFVTAVTSERREVNGDPLDTRRGIMTVPDKERVHLREGIGNTAARLRMAIAYFEANTTERLVLGTGNRTELLVGYFTKHGDGAVDLLPIGDLYKTEIRELARELGVAERIIEKQPTAGLWAGQTDEDELGVSYETLDTVLWNLRESDADIEAVATASDVGAEIVTSIVELYEASEHKRVPPQTPAGVSNWRPERRDSGT